MMCLCLLFFTCNRWNLNTAWKSTLPKAENLLQLLRYSRTCLNPIWLVNNVPPSSLAGIVHWACLLARHWWCWNLGEHETVRCCSFQHLHPKNMTSGITLNSWIEFGWLLLTSSAWPRPVGIVAMSGQGSCAFSNPDRVTIAAYTQKLSKQTT